MTVQVQACSEIDGCVVRVPWEEADFWGVYQGEPGGYEWIADFQVRDDAMMFANLVAHNFDDEVEVLE